MGKIKIPKTTEKYVRIGVDYYKVIEKPDRYGIVRTELKGWNMQTLKQDYTAQFESLLEIPKYEDFTVIPDNVNYVNGKGKFYNHYAKFAHKPVEGKWCWTFKFLKHIFGNQFKIGMQYMQALYLHPERILPVLVLISKERQTGKTTFLDWLGAIYGPNVANIEPDMLNGNFNSAYAGANIIALDETVLDKPQAMERIKSLSTRKTINVNMKYKANYEVPFFGKIIMTTNNEDRFIKIEQEEIRYFIRKLGMPKEANHNILYDMISEIPAFLHYLKSMPPLDFSKSRMLIPENKLHNEHLDRVKEESKSGLFHELVEMFDDWFLNNELVDELEFVPQDVKEKWFAHNNQISLNYIRKTIKNEFFLTPYFKLKKYYPFGGEPRTGRPYTLKRSMFLDGKYKNKFVTSEILLPSQEGDTEDFKVPF